MKITFNAAFQDGLLPMVGDLFEVDGRAYVVHKGREPYDKEYRVSHLESGFAVPIGKTHNKATAIKSAKVWLGEIVTAPWLDSLLKEAAEKKATLKIIAS